MQQHSRPMPGLRSKAEDELDLSFVFPTGCDEGFDDGVNRIEDYLGGEWTEVVHIELHRVGRGIRAHAKRRQGGLQSHSARELVVVEGNLGWGQYIGRVLLMPFSAPRLSQYSRLSLHTVHTKD